jgi:hypothetical protein
MSQMPWHNPEHQRLLEYFKEWMGRYEQGDDMTRSFGLGALVDQAAVA